MKKPVISTITGFWLYLDVTCCPIFQEQCSSFQPVQLRYGQGQLRFRHERCDSDILPLRALAPWTDRFSRPP